VFPGDPLRVAEGIERCGLGLGLIRAGAIACGQPEPGEERPEMSRKKNRHRGSTFESFLKEEGILAEVQERAIRRMLARALALKMRDEELTKTAMAERLETSRSRLEVLLDPEDTTNLGIATLAKAAEVLGKQLHLELRKA